MKYKLPLALVIVFSLALAIIASSFAANNAKPGDALYGLDKANESLVLAINKLRGPEAEANNYLNLADERLKEYEELKNGSSANTGIIRQVSAEGANEEETSKALQEFENNLGEAERIALRLQIENDTRSRVVARNILNSTDDFIKKLDNLNLEDTSDYTEEVEDGAMEIILQNEELEDSEKDILSQRVQEKLTKLSAKLSRYINLSEGENVNGISGLINDTQTSLSLAENYISQEDFLSAKVELDNADRVLDEMELLIDEVIEVESEDEDPQTEARQKIARAENLINTLKNQSSDNADIKDEFDDLLDLSSETLDSAKSAYDNEQYLLAKKLAQEAEKTAIQAKVLLIKGEKGLENLEDDAQNEIDDAQDKLRDLKEKQSEKQSRLTTNERTQLQSRIQVAQDLLDQALSLYENGHYALAYRAAVNSQLNIRIGLSIVDSEEIEDETEDETEDERERENERDDENDDRSGRSGGGDDSEDDEEEDKEDNSGKGSSVDDDEDEEDDSDDEEDDDDVLGIVSDSYFEELLKSYSKLNN